MKKDLAMPQTSFKSSFLSCEKDLEIILRKLFIESQPFSNKLIRLLAIDSKDCLENNTDKCKEKIQLLSLAELIKQGYVRTTPVLFKEEFAEIQSYILISFDNFVTNETNPNFRDCSVSFDIICNTETWDIGNYRLRPLKIAGYIDGILNNQKLTGIGTFQFIGGSQLILSEKLGGYSIHYLAIHGNDDKIPPKES